MKTAVLLIVIFVSTGVAHGQSGMTIDFSGFLYEPCRSVGGDGFPPSNPGDVLVGISRNINIDPLWGWDTSQVELTWFITSLISDGEIDIGYGTFYTTFSGGEVYIFADAYADPSFTKADYGTNPPNSTAPSTFIDGEMYLGGIIESFYMVYYPTLHVGNFEGVFNWAGGSQYPGLFNTYASMFAGTVDPIAAPVPNGYDLETDGHIMHYGFPKKLTSTWGQVKALYR